MAIADPISRRYPSKVAEPQRRLLLQQTREVELLHRQLDVALNNMGRGLSMFDANARLIICNKMYQELYALPDLLTLPGTPLAALVRHHVVSQTGRDDAVELKRQRLWIASHVAEMVRGKSFSHTQYLKSGRIVLVSNQPLPEGGWVDIQEDITEKHHAEAKIDWLAKHDTLTEVANRHQFREQLCNWTAEAAAGTRFALHSLDLDHFKNVNDTLGHPVGDALLKSVAIRLRKVLRGTDLVARLGGDEFAILQARAEHQEAKGLAARMIDALSEPHLIQGHKITTHGSIGIALAPADGSDPEQLMKNADLGLYAAKHAGRGGYVFFRTEAGCNTAR
jgi:diguanylate cyclase (GGDEF)-like protein